jgi:hypothetical protein
VVGPTATMESAWLLLKAAACYRNATAGATTAVANTTTAEAETPQKQQLTCTVDDVFDGEDSAAEHIAWLAKLVATRSLYIMPATNALGFYAGTREEAGIDPNRDFPYHQKPTQCMQVLAESVLTQCNAMATATTQIAAH